MTQSEIDETLRITTEIITGLAEVCHEQAVEKGFWSQTTPCAFCAGTGKKEDTICLACKGKGSNEKPIERNVGELIALIHSELSEALEGLRHGNPNSEHIPEFSAVEEEMADACIRIFDFAAAHKYRLGEAIIAKLLFNKNREHKHGKQF